MESRSDNDRARWWANPNKRNSAASESDQSSLISCGSATFSLSDSQFSEGSRHGSNTQRTQINKASDVAEGSRRSTQRPSSRTSSLTTAEIESSELERQLLLDAGPAPPNYAQATAHRTAHTSRNTDEDSLYAADDENTSFHPSSHNSKRKGIRRLIRQNWRRCCLLNLAIYCILTTVLLVAGLFITQRPLPRYAEDRIWIENFPAEHPLNNRFHQERFHESTEQCRYTSYPEDFFFFDWLDPENFHFQESLPHFGFDGTERIGDGRISGRVEVRPAPYGQSEPIEAIVSYAMTSNWEAGIPDRYKDSETLHIYRSTSNGGLLSQSADQEMRPDSTNPKRDDPAIPCLDIWVGIYIKAQLYNFSLITENLHVDFGQSYSSNRYGGFSFRIRENSEIRTRIGNITISDWDARNAKVTSEAGSITGTFGLNNNLHLETTGGEIDVAVYQQAAHEKNYLDSHPPGTPANLSTRTGPGKQSVRIQDQLNAILWAEKYMGLGFPFALQSSHHSDSGSISIESGMYWQGHIHVKSNGSIDLQGNEVQLIHNPVDEIARGDEAKDLWAKKGTRDYSLMTIETGDGDVSVCAPEDWECHDFLPYMSGPMVDDREPTEIDWDNLDPCEMKQCQGE